MLDSGDPFPDFSLQDQGGTTHTKSDLLGSPVVIYFYPKDDTSGCTVEACEFRDRLAEIPGAKVYGVSPDPVRSHKRFAEKYGLTFPLLADVEKSLCTGCGVWVEKSMYGKKYMGVERTTFVLDSQGKVASVFRKVKPAGHAAEVLASLPG
ncbi:MAG: peroxiredoxin [Fimbriimonadaceae bacterium]|nr:peroxiredoxin [Fimbriimonadaceae bacterium]